MYNCKQVTLKAGHRKTKVVFKKKKKRKATDSTKQQPAIKEKDKEKQEANLDRVASQAANIFFAFIVVCDVTV